MPLPYHESRGPKESRQRILAGLAFLGLMALLSIEVYGYVNGYSGVHPALLVAGVLLFFVAIGQRSSEIRITTGEIAVRRGVFGWKRMASSDVVEANAIPVRVPGPRAGRGERVFYKGVEVRLTNKEGRAVKLRSIEPRLVLGALDDVLASSVRRSGDGWKEYQGRR